MIVLAQSQPSRPLLLTAFTAICVPAATFERVAQEQFISTFDLRKPSVMRSKRFQHGPLL